MLEEKHKAFLLVKMAKKLYKFRLYPNQEQVTKLHSWLGMSRELYNAALQERIGAWKERRISISYPDQNKSLTEVKQIRPEFATVNSHVLQDTLQKLDKSFKAFFRRVKSGEKAGFPRFKGKNRFNSFSFPNTRYKITGKHLDLSRFGKIKMKQDCEIIGELKTATIKESCGKWYVSIVVEFTPKVLPKTNQQIGLDVGLKTFLTDSEGKTVSNERYAERLQKKVRMAQRRVARRQKGSNGRREAVLLLKKIHERIFNQRNYFQHNLSTELVKDYDLIAIEKLNIKGLTKGMLAKQVLDASWSSFFQMLRYKAENAGKKLIEVNPNGTSQTCICGANVPKILSQRWHQCDACSIECDRDFMSARVVLQRALNQSVQTLT